MSQSSKVSKQFGSVTSTGSSVQQIYGSGARGAVSLATAVSVVKTTGAATGTLADGAEGQVKTIIMTTDGGDYVLTPAHLTGGTTVTLSAVGGSAILLYSGSSWYVLNLSASGAAVA